MIPIWVIRYALPAASAALLILAVMAWINGQKHVAATQAVATERASSTQHSLNQVEKANDVRDEVRDDRSRAAYDECLRSARNRENCQRFLPQ